MADFGVKKPAFAAPFTVQFFRPDRTRFIDREFLVASCRTDPDALKEPAPLTMTGRIAKYQFK